MSGYELTYKLTMSNPIIYASKFVALSVFLMVLFFYF